MRKARPRKEIEGKLWGQECQSDGEGGLVGEVPGNEYDDGDNDGGACVKGSIWAGGHGGANDG